MAQELTTRQNNLPANYDNGLDDLELDKNDERYPILSINQPVGGSPKDTKGWFKLESGQEYETVKCIFLKVSQGRILFDADMSKPPLCASNDRINPAPIIEEPKNSISDGGCISCKWNQRGYKEQVKIGKDTRTIQCDPTYSIAGVMVDDMIPFLFRVKRTGLKSFLPLITVIKSKLKMVRTLKLQNFLIELSVQFEQEPGKSYYRPIFKQIGTTDNEELMSISENAKEHGLDNATSFNPEEFENKDDTDDIEL